MFHLMLQSAPDNPPVIFLFFHHAEHWCSQTRGKVPSAVPALCNWASSRTQVASRQVLFLHQHCAVERPGVRWVQGRESALLVWACMPAEAGWEPLQQGNVCGSLQCQARGQPRLTFSRLSLWCFLRPEKTSSTLPGEKLFKDLSVSTVFWAGSAYILPCCENMWRLCIRSSEHR